jgi:hypothetical protein
MPSCRVTRPQDELISQKSGPRSTFLTQPHRQPLFFDAQYLLTSKNSLPILPAIESNALSKKINQTNKQTMLRSPGCPLDRGDRHPFR